MAELERDLNRDLATAGGFLEKFLDGLDDAPARRLPEPDALRAVAEPPGEQPGDLDQLLETVGVAASMAVETAGPRYLGYVPGGGLVSSAVGGLLGSVLNRYTGLADLAPGLVALEEGVLRWLVSVFGLPPGAGGLLTTGGSQAMLSMALAVRERRFGDGDLSRARIYLSDQAHHSIEKAARVVGFPAAAVRHVPTGDGRRLDADAVASAVTADRAAGLEPALLVGNGGTTNAGTVDPLCDLADVAEQHGLWYHVDACYGGFFQLTGRGRARFAGIERADSVTLDPHKSLFLPYGTGALLVRDRASFAGADGGHRAEYMQDLADRDLPDYATLGTELTREPRGLRLWLPLHLHGVAAFRTALDEKLDLAQHAYDTLAAMPHADVLEPPDLSTVVFRVPGGDDANRSVLDRVNGTGRVFWSSTRLDGRLTLRLCILSFRTHRPHVDEALDAVHTAAVEHAG